MADVGAGPAQCGFPAGDRGVIGVTSTDSLDALAIGANYGPAVFMAAPGVDITTTSAGGSVATICGDLGSCRRGRRGRGSSFRPTSLPVPVKVELLSQCFPGTTVTTRTLHLTIAMGNQTDLEDDAVPDTLVA